MKIVHTEASLGWGGQEIRVLDESRGMIERGHEVTLLCPREAKIFTEAARFGVKAVALPIGRKNLAGVLAMRRWLNVNKPDVVNTHSSTDSWLVALALATSGRKAPLVRTRHVSTAIHNKLSTRWLYTKATSHIVTTGEALRQQLIDNNQFPPELLTSVPTGIDPDLYKPADKLLARQNLGLPTDKPLIGIVATLRSWKGHKFLLNACAKIVDQNWHLVIVGDGPTRKDLEQLTTELNLQDRVTFTGQSNTANVWMQALDIFCLPSYANEGVPQALLQAMLTALPVISTEVGAIPEIVHHDQTGVIIPIKDADALAAAITDLLRDPTRCERLGEAARELIQAKHSRNKMLDSMESIFSNAIARNNK